jgi:starch synthase
MSKLNIAYISSEVVPFAKTGGLADVAGALPRALAKMGNSVKVFMPLYAAVDITKYNIICFKNDLGLDIAGHKETFDLYHCRFDDSECDFYFIKMDKYYGRKGLYGSPETGLDWPDNDLRFTAFARATLESIMALGFKPDIINCNDWQSALIPAYIKCENYGLGYFEKTATLLTIHNIGYQGLFPPETFAKLGFEPKWYYPTSGFEYYKQVSFLKAGLTYSDILNTVSEKYAKEIQSSPEYGNGMEGILAERAEDLFGVVNGIDYNIWNPASDTLIASNYSPEKPEGKAKNKSALRRLMGLPISRRDIPLIGMISRMANQKGFDIIAEAAEQIFEMDIQIAVLGTGDKQYEELFASLAKKYPKKLAISMKFDDKLAHQIEAGSDMFLMPSRYEPCGLNQLYSLKYGTVPIVRETGGLADTIENCNPGKHTGTGFVFKNYDSRELLNTIKFAAEVYKNKAAWTKLVKRGMLKDFSWDNSAGKYIQLYEKAISKKGAKIAVR